MNKLFTRINLRFSIRNITCFFMVAKTQTVSGVVSDIGNKEHIVLWDIEGCNIDQCLISLLKVQEKYKLGKIYVLSDRVNSFGAVCFTRVDFLKLLRIMIDTDYIDSGFIVCTAKRYKATLRMSAKNGRGEREVIFTIPSSDSEVIPDKIKTVVYDTGLVKDGLKMVIEI